MVYLLFETNDSKEETVSFFSALFGNLFKYQSNKKMTLSDKYHLVIKFFKREYMTAF